MLSVREGANRRHTSLSGLETWMAFDAENRDDLFCDGFRTLQALDEKSLEPGGIIPWRTRDDLETLTCVLDGIVLHTDSRGHEGVLRTGDFQLMSAGSGMRHVQVNGSRLDRAHIIESRLLPEARGRRPECDQKRFSVADRKGLLCLIASPVARETALFLRQDVRVYSSLPDRGCHMIHELQPGRRAWLQVLKGSIRLDRFALAAGDGVAFQDERSVSLTAVEPSEVLLFDLA
jgi:redox-sensitive bicupin YhaK (pirin superfamily)